MHTQLSRDTQRAHTHSALNAHSTATLTHHAAHTAVRQSRRRYAALHCTHTSRRHCGGTARPLLRLSQLRLYLSTRALDSASAPTEQRLLYDVDHDADLSQQLAMRAASAASGC